MLVAEYRIQDSRLLYYASDQINSTRIVTDTNGTVVYSAAHEPYGGIQKTWVSSYDPSLKFSGKERDAESELDYFGARYYDRSLYRFLNTDPIASQRGYLIEVNGWNLYAYCGDNPLVNIDRKGAWKSKVHYNVTYAAMMMAFDEWDPNFAAALAEIVASSCSGVDSDPSTTSTPYVDSDSGGDLIWNFPNLRQRQQWHFPLAEDLERAYDIAKTNLDPREFGKALHVIQDWFSHSAYVESGSHLYEYFASLFGGRDPDNPLEFWDAALAMAYMTLDLCYAYEARLKDFYGHRI